MGKTQRMILEHLTAHTEELGVYQPTTHEVAERCGLTVDQAKSALIRLKTIGKVGSTDATGRTAARWSLLPGDDAQTRIV